MANVIPKFYKKEIIDSLVGETLKLMLLSDSHVPNAGTQEFIDDVSANEITDGGAVYTAGGVALAGKIAVADNNNYYLDATDMTIGPNAYLDYRYGVLYKDTGNPATSPIRAHIDFSTDQVVVNGTSTIRWNTLGIIYVQ